MSVTILIIEFLIFSVIGWVIDSLYRTIDENKWVNAGYFKGPFCPIYGFGGVILLYIFKNLAGLPLLLQVVSASFSLIAVEYVGGVFSEKILKIKLWDYSSSRFHLGGHIDLLHSFYWVLLTILFYFTFYPLALLLESRLLIPEFIELPMLLVFVFGGIWLTFRKAPAQILEIHGKVMNMTIQGYKELYSTISRLSRTHSLSVRKKLQDVIQQQLKNTNATLRKIPFKRN